MLVTTPAQQYLNEVAANSYAWAHFALHAERRWSALRFFVLIAVVLTAGSFSLMWAHANVVFVVPVSGALALLALLLWLYDRRLQAVCELSIAAMRAQDSQIAQSAASNSAANALRIFDSDTFLRSRQLIGGGLDEGRIYASIYGVGLALAIYLAVLPLVTDKPFLAETPKRASAPAAQSSSLDLPHSDAQLSYSVPPSVTPVRRTNAGPNSPSRSIGGTSSPRTQP